MFDTLRMKASMEGAWTVSWDRTFQSFYCLREEAKLSLICAAGVLSISLAVSPSRSCGLGMEFRELDHCQPIGDLNWASDIKLQAIISQDWKERKNLP